MIITDNDTLRQWRKKYNFFRTPEEVADRMAYLIDDLGLGAKILEPHAGDGALIRAVVKAYPHFPVNIHFCEIQDELCSAYVESYKKVGSDFLAFFPTDDERYNGVIMNPPYKNGIDMAHVDHAWDCIRPGGKVVCLISKATAELVEEEYSGYISEMEVFNKKFKDTRIDAVMFLLQKPLYFV